MGPVNSTLPVDIRRIIHLRGAIARYFALREAVGDFVRYRRGPGETSATRRPECRYYIERWEPGNPTRSAGFQRGRPYLRGIGRDILPRRSAAVCARYLRKPQENIGGPMARRPSLRRTKGGPGNPDRSAQIQRYRHLLGAKWGIQAAWIFGRLRTIFRNPRLPRRAADQPSGGGKDAIQAN